MPKRRSKSTRKRKSKKEDASRKHQLNDYQEMDSTILVTPNSGKKT